MPPKGIRTYVDVYLKVDQNGLEAPLAIVLPNGRTFKVDRIVSRRLSDGELALTIAIGEHITYIWKEANRWARPRWYVVEGGGSRLEPNGRGSDEPGAGLRN